MENPTIKCILKFWNFRLYLHRNYELLIDQYSFVIDHAPVAQSVYTSLRRDNLDRASDGVYPDKVGRSEGF